MLFYGKLGWFPPGGYSVATDMTVHLPSFHHYTGFLLADSLLNGNLRVFADVLRHLVLPGHVKESRAILRYLKEALPPGCAVSLMGQYVPCGRARQFPEIDRPLTAREYDRAVQTFMELDFEYGFVQERGAASKAFIPDFALQGLPEQG